MHTLIAKAFVFELENFSVGSHNNNTVIVVQSKGKWDAANLYNSKNNKLRCNIADGVIWTMMLNYMFNFLPNYLTVGVYVDSDLSRCRNVFLRFLYLLLF